MEQLNSFIRDPDSLFTYIPSQGLLQPFNGSNMLPLEPDGAIHDTSLSAMLEAFNNIGMYDDFSIEVDVTIDATSGQAVEVFYPYSETPYGTNNSPPHGLFALYFYATGQIIGFTSRTSDPASPYTAYNLVPVGSSEFQGKVRRAKFKLEHQNETITWYIDDVQKAPRYGIKYSHDIRYVKSQRTWSTVLYHSFKVHNLTTGYKFEYPTWEVAAQLTDNRGVYVSNGYLKGQAIQDGSASENGHKRVPALILNTTLAGRAPAMTFIFAGRFVDADIKNNISISAISCTHPTSSHDSATLDFILTRNRSNGGDTTRVSAYVTFLTSNGSRVNKEVAYHFTSPAAADTFIKSEHVVAFTVSTTEMTLYVDGDSVATVDIPSDVVEIAPYAGGFPAEFKDILPLGVCQFSNTNGFNCIAEGRYYQCILRTLTDSEIKAVTSLLTSDQEKKSFLSLKTTAGALGATFSKAIDVLTQDGTLYSNISGAAQGTLQVDEGTTLIRGTSLSVINFNLNATTIPDASVPTDSIPRETYSLTAGRKLIGNIKDLPPGLEIFYSYNNDGSLVGNIADLPDSVNYLYLYCGNLANFGIVGGGRLPSKLATLYLFYATIDLSKVPIPAPLCRVYFYSCQIQGASTWSLANITSLTLLHCDDASFDYSTLPGDTTHKVLALTSCYGQAKLTNFYGHLPLGGTDLRVNLDNVNIKALDPSAPSSISIYSCKHLNGCLSPERVPNGFNTDSRLDGCPQMNPADVKRTLAAVAAKSVAPVGKTFRYGSYYEPYVTDELAALEAKGWTVLRLNIVAPTAPQAIVSVTFDGEAFSLTQSSWEGHTINIDVYTDEARTNKRATFYVKPDVLSDTKTTVIPKSTINVFGKYYISFTIASYGGNSARYDFPDQVDLASNDAFEVYLESGDTISIKPKIENAGMYSVLKPDGSPLVHNMQSDAIVSETTDATGWHKIVTTTRFTELSFYTPTPAIDLAWLPNCPVISAYRIKGNAKLWSGITYFANNLSEVGTHIDLTGLVNLTQFQYYGSAKGQLSGGISHLTKLVRLILYEVSCDFTLNLTDIPDTVTNLQLVSIATVSGALQDLSRLNLSVLLLNKTLGITGDLSDLSNIPNMLSLRNMPGITGDLKDIKAPLSSLTLQKIDGITGAIEVLPTGIASLELGDMVSITGYINGAELNNKTLLRIYSCPYVVLRPKGLAAAKTVSLYDLASMSAASYDGCVTKLVASGVENGSLALSSLAINPNTESRLTELEARGWAINRRTDTVPPTGQLTNVTFEEDGSPLTIQADLTTPREVVTFYTYTDETYSTVSHQRSCIPKYDAAGKLNLNIIDSGAITDDIMGVYPYWRVALPGASATNNGQGLLILRSKTKAVIPTVAGALSLSITDSSSQTFKVTLPDGTIVENTNININQQVTAGTLTLEATDFSRGSVVINFKSGTNCFDQDIGPYLPDLRHTLALRETVAKQTKTLPRVGYWLEAHPCTGDVQLLPKTANTLSTSGASLTGNIIGLQPERYLYVSTGNNTGTTCDLSSLVSQTNTTRLYVETLTGTFDASNTLHEVYLQQKALTDAEVNLSTINPNLVNLYLYYVNYTGSLPTMVAPRTFRFYDCGGAALTTQELHDKLPLGVLTFDIGSTPLTGAASLLPVQGTSNYFRLYSCPDVFGALPAYTGSAPIINSSLFGCDRLYGPISSYAGNSNTCASLPCVTAEHLNAFATALLAITPAKTATLSSRIDSTIIQQLRDAGWTVTVYTDPATTPTIAPTLSYDGTIRSLNVGFTEALTGVRFQYSSTEDFSADVTTVNLPLRMTSTSNSQHKIADLCDQVLGYRYVRVCDTGDAGAASPWSNTVNVMLGAGHWVLPVRAGKVNIQTSGFENLKWTLPDGTTNTSSWLNIDITEGLLICEYTGLTPSSVLTMYSNSTPTVLSDIRAADLPRVQHSFVVFAHAGFNGTMADMPRTINTLTVSGSSLMNGSIAGIHPDVRKLTLNRVSITGDTSEVPRDVTYLYLASLTNLTGTIADLPRMNGGTIYLMSLPNVTGTTADVPRVNSTLYLAALPGLSGPVSDLPNNLGERSVHNCQLVTGALSMSSGNSPVMYFGNAAVTPAEYDQTIQNVVDAGRTGNNIFNIDSTRTSASDANIELLRSRGWTVTEK